ncbi:hypothetical protein [Streptomyces avermitilis]|uniref:hypothetical protein n=1 Tax=Streptomyces avermitilis TaxID=33903 RepID=UPI0036B226E5
MAEHDSDREPEEKGVPIDEEAAWAAIVAGYGEEPPDPPGAKPFKSIEDLALLDPETNDGDAGAGSGADSGSDSDADPGSDTGSDAGSGSGSADKPSAGEPLGSSVAFAPGIGGGPRDYAAPDASEDDFDEDDEGHFVPPEPPPLPAADATAKFAWLGVVGGPILLLLAVLLGWDMTWWLTTVGIGGFLGGFATLVMRMRTGDEDDEDPGRGAVV